MAMDLVPSFFLSFPVVVTFGSLIIYTAVVGVYRLYFHALSSFPGPKIAAATGWYEAYFDVCQNGQYTFKIADLHRRYGPIIRISPRELHINDPSYHEILFRYEGRWDKYNWAYEAHGVPSAAVCTIDHDVHRHRRAALNPFFSKARIAANQDIIRSRVEKLYDRIGAVSITGGTIELGYAKRFHRAMTHMTRASGAIWRITKHFPLYGRILLAIPRPLIERIAGPDLKAFLNFIKVTEAQTYQIMNVSAENDGLGEKSPYTLVHEITRSDRLQQSDKELRRVTEEVSTVVGAGFETAAQTLRLVLFYIYNNHKILHRLRYEIRDSGISFDSTTSSKRSGRSFLSQLEQLPYLTGVLMEGLRMSPGLATRQARVAPDRELLYKSWIIPAGTPVGMTVLLMHYDEDIFPNPHTFNPDRWLESESARKAEKFFAHFSKGTRNCIGMYVALAELYMTIAYLVSKFDFEFLDATVEDVAPYSDQFIVGTKGHGALTARVKTLQA